jgi:hypothetical protein
MALKEKQLEIVEVYTALCEDLKKFPNRNELLEAGVSRDKIRSHFGNLEKLKSAATKECPEIKEFVSKKLHVLSDFTKESLGNIIKENDYQEGTFFVTAVNPVSHLDWSDKDHKEAEKGNDVMAHNLFKPGFAAVENFLNRKDAELVLLPMPAHVKALQEQPLHYDPDLVPFKEAFVTEFTFNSHLKAIEAHINPQQGNPLTGLKRLRVHKYTHDYQEGKEIKRPKTSLIVAHSKQMLEVLPTGNESHPRLIHSTGTICTPSYLRNKMGMIANEDHKLGGLIIEIKGDVFWLRQVQFDVKNGSFVDLGQRYHADGTVTKERAEAFKMGDLHPGFHSQVALDSLYRLWDLIKPKRIFFEDFFDGASISHHTEKKRLTRAKLHKLKPCFKDLPTEIAMAKKVLEEIWKKAPKDAELIATASNHPEHVAQYLDRGAYINDVSENFEIAHRMVVMDLDGKNPLKEYLDPNGKMNWTDQNKDYFVEGCQMNAHGHLGIGGARGSQLSHELAYGSSMTAHTHKPSIYHDQFTVGHASEDRHGYNSGPQNWIICSGAVYKGGQKQLYMTVKGSAFRPRDKKKKK